MRFGMWRGVRQWLSRRCRVPCLPLVLLCLVTLNVLLMGGKTLTMINVEDDTRAYQEVPKVTQSQTQIRKMLKLTSAEEKVNNPEPAWIQPSGQEMTGLESLSRYKEALSQGRPQLSAVPRQQKGFLTIGIPSIPRPGTIYLHQTLDSIINQTTPEERQTITVVIYLGSMESSVVDSSHSALLKRYNKHIQNGFIHILRAIPETYPSLNIKKRNYKDNYERIKWRSKQVVDYAYLFTYAHELNEYYLQLEDDVLCAKNFVSAVRSYISSVREYWVTLHFSDLGYIGKLHRSSELPSLATFFMLFYYEEPVDFLLPDYENMRHQQNKFLRKPTLFQHMGRTSSHKGLENKLFDVYFESVAVRRMADNPPATLYTDIRVFQRHLIANAYQGSGNYFWGVSPRPGNFVLVVFHKPVKIYRVLIHTGSPRVSNDFMRDGILEASSAKEGAEDPKSRGSCNSDFVPVGEVKNAVIDTGNRTKSLNFETKCLRLQVTKSQNSWLIIRSISVFTHDTDI